MNQTHVFRLLGYFFVWAYAQWPTLAHAMFPLKFDDAHSSTSSLTLAHPPVSFHLSIWANQQLIHGPSAQPRGTQSHHVSLSSVRPTDWRNATALPYTRTPYSINRPNFGTLKNKGPLLLIFSNFSVYYIGVNLNVKNPNFSNARHWQTRATIFFAQHSTSFTAYRFIQCIDFILIDHRVFTHDCAHTHYFYTSSQLMIQFALIHFSKTCHTVRHRHYST